MVTCQESFRGLLWFNRDDIDGDDLYVCRKEEGSETFEWQELGGGGIELLAQDTPSAPSLESKDQRGNVTLVPLTTCVSNNPQYKFEGGDWQDSNVFSNLDHGDINFYQRCDYSIDCGPSNVEECSVKYFPSETSASSTFSVENCSQRSIGQACGGGVVAYHDGDGGGLIAATSDQSTGVQWGCYGSTIGSTSTAYGTGLANTNRIMSQCATRPIAASVARAHTGGGYDDWFLPSKDELDAMYNAGFDTGNSNYYWSSSEYDSYLSWYQRFSNGTQFNNFKYITRRVRAVRAF